MKPKLSIGLSILISLLLLVFGLVYGNVSGYADDRARVVALLTGDNGLTTVVGYRASDALNLCVVAGRHISGDASVAALRKAADAVRDGETSATRLKADNDALSVAFQTVAANLRASDSFEQTARDQKYLDMLSADFTQYGQSEIYAAYNKAVTAYNASLSAPVTGDVARFFGVSACELFE